MIDKSDEAAVPVRLLKPNSSKKYIADILSVVG